MTDKTLRRSDEIIGTVAEQNNSGSEHLMARFRNRMEAETAVRRLKEMGIPSGVIALTGAEQSPRAKPRVHIAEGMLLGIAVGSLLGGLFGAIFAVPATQLLFMGQIFTGEIAGAISGLGYGFLLGIVMGVIVGVLSKATAASPIIDFDELNRESAFVDVDVPKILVPQVQEILNAA